MKNKMKRVLAFVVAFAMVFTLMPGNSLVSRAEETTGTFMIDYDDANGASVSCTVGSGELFKPTRFAEYNFLAKESVAQIVTFTLTPPSSVPDGETADVHVLANGQDLEVQNNTVTFTPDADKSYFIRICWTQEEYNYESFDVNWEQEVSDFMVEYNVRGRGTVSLKSTPERTATRGTSTKAIYLSTDNVEFLLTPDVEKDFVELRVGQIRYSKQDLIDDLFSNGKLEQTEEGLIFTLNTGAYEDNGRAEWMEFIFTDDSSQGGGNQSGTFMIDYDEANGASVLCKVGDNTPYNPDRFTNYSFVTGEGEAQTVTFTLTPPSNVPDGETAKVNVLANGQELDVQDNTATLNPNVNESYFIKICWTQEEYNYEVYGADSEVSDFMVEYNVNGRGAVTLKTPTDKKVTRGTSTKAIYSTTNDSVEFILTPEEGKDFAELIVGRQTFSKQELMEERFENGKLAQTEEGLVFTLITSACDDNDSAEWMEFRFTDDNPSGPEEGGATNRDTYATYENSATSTLTVTGKAEGYINGSWFSNIEAIIENQNIEYPVPFDPRTIQLGDEKKVEFEFVTLINERYTSIKINDVDYTNQIPGMQAELEEDEITQAVLNAIALNGNNQDTSFIIEVPYAESYTVEATRVEIGSEDAAYWPVGNFLWSGVDMSGDEPEGPSFISVENEQYGGMVDYEIGELSGKYSYFTPSDVSEGTTVKLIVCDTNGAPTAKISGGTKDGELLEFTSVNANEYETKFTYTSDMTGIVVTLAEGTEEVETYQDSVEGGSFELLKFTYKGTTYTRADNQSWDEVFREKNLPCYFDWTQNFDRDGNLLNGGAVFPAGTELTIQLLPDYGHQLTAFGFNGRSLNAGSEAATYTVTVPNGNFHINCLFEEVAPTTKVDEHNTVVTEAGLRVRETDVPVESGTLNMTVKDAALYENKYPDALAAVDINLENVFYDVNTGRVKDEWTNDVKELNNQVEVTLKVEGLDTNKAYQVLREHYVQNGNGDPVLNTDTLEAQVNEDGTITFESDRFSTYVIEEAPDIVCNQDKDVTLRFWKFDEEQRSYVPAYDSIGYFYINNGLREDGGNPFDIPGSRLKLHNGFMKRAGRLTGTNELLFQGDIGSAISGAYLLSNKAQFNEAGILTDPDFASSTNLSTIDEKNVIGNDGSKPEHNIYAASLAVTENASETYDILVETKSRHTIVWENHETVHFGADALIENGAATLVSVTDANGNNLLETGEANYSGDGDSGYCMIPDGAYVTIKLIPDYGYQVLSASIAGGSATLTPNTDVSSFTFKMPSTNVHFSGIMQQANDKLTENAEKVSAVTIADGKNAAAYGGNLQLTVTDNTSYDKLSDVADTAGKSAEVKVEQVATLDLKLDNIVNQAAADKYWTENVTSFEKDIKVNLTLDNVTLADGEKLVVVREHDGKLEKIEAQYQDGVITVPTNKFSTYSIVKTSPITECEHTYVAEVNSAISNQLVSKATCTSKAKYYKYCSKCNALSAETFESGEVDKTNHVGDTEVRGAKTATCVVDGYTGDTYCKACDTKISSGTVIKAAGHSFVAEVNAKITNQLASKATCTSKAKYYKYCSVCNELSTETFEYGEVDKTNHVGDTEVRGAKKASCTEDGYTGDTYCKACDTKISSGTVIKAAGHKFDAGKVTKEPTVDAEGVKTYTCTVCGATKTEPIAKLPKPEPTPEPKPELPGEEFAENNGNIFTEDEEGDIRCFTEDGEPVIDEFMCDGEYTYYFQADGTAMKDRLTYHPDGVHVIYFDENGHEVFSDFAHITRSIAGEEVDDYCFFDVYGHMYVDTLTYDKTGTKLYYINEYGLLQHTGWFAFSGHEFEAGLGFEGKAGGYGYANADGSLMTNCYTYDWDGNFVYIQGDGHMFR